MFRQYEEPIFRELFDSTSGFSLGFGLVASFAVLIPISRLFCLPVSDQHPLPFGAFQRLPEQRIAEEVNQAHRWLVCGALVGIHRLERFRGNSW